MSNPYVEMIEQNVSGVDEAPVIGQYAEAADINTNPNDETTFVGSAYDNISGDDPWLGHDDPLTMALDIPADAVNATTGTGEELGFFGEVDKHLDYRSLTGELDPNDPDDWAEPTAETTGLTGAFHAVAGQTAAANEDVNQVADAALKTLTPDWMNWFVENPWLTAVVLVGGFAFLYADGLGQVGDVTGGGS